MFIDHVKIKVKAGDGGNGCVSFLREKFVPLGGPDGGDGGKGGDVIFIASKDVMTLMDFHYNASYRARSGHHGQGKNKTGSGGGDIEIILPIGTQIYDVQKHIIADLTKDREKVVILKGGQGGRGNARFVSSTNRAPRQKELGRAGEEQTLHLELKLIADFALVGLPNAGKSTLISVLSDARPKIASYPFTSLNPNLGVVEYNDFDRIIIADIPGLIEGAHDGAGLGFEFLRHIERTKGLIFICDVGGESKRDPAQDFHVLQNEISLYNDQILRKPYNVVANKIDMRTSEKCLKDFKKSLSNESIMAVSAKEKIGCDELLCEIKKIFDNFKE